jgi:hypothetical protein
MWIVLKYKRNEFNFLKQDFKKALGSIPVIIRPKFKYEKLIKNKIKFFEDYILGDYLICYHDKFKEINKLPIFNNLRGLKYFLKDSYNNQKEIVNFINYCKTNQNQEGHLKQSFFNFSAIKKGIFINGLFTNSVFSVIENQKTKMKILIGNVKATIAKDSNFLYRSI